MSCWREPVRAQGRQSAWIARLILAAALSGYPAIAVADWVILATRINGVSGPDLVVLREEDGETFIKLDDLGALRLDVQPPVARHDDGHEWVSLTRLTGLTLTLDPVNHRLDIVVDPALLPLTRLDDAMGGRSAERLGQGSAFFNWGLEYAESGASRSGRLSNELGLRVGKALLQTNGTTRGNWNAQRYVRLSTSITRDWPELQRRLVAGDFFVQAHDLAGGANLGGISASRVFTLDPYQSRRSAPVLQGQLLYPSEVEIYVDGRQVRREQLPAGGFEIQNLYLSEGGRSVQVVSRDPYGRQQTTDYSFYASESLLREGTSEFQYAVGALRRGYGQRSADYGPWAFSAYQRVGLSPQLTMGGMVQGRDGLLQAGVMGVVPLALGPGLLSWGLATSHTDTASGRAASANYNLNRTAWNAAFSWRHEGLGYAALSEPLSRSPGRDTVGVYGSVRLGDLGSLSASQSLQIANVFGGPQPLVSPPTGRRVRQSTALGWTRSLGSSSWVRSDWTRLRDGDTVLHRLSLTVSIAFDRRTRLSLSGSSNPDQGSSDSHLLISRPLWAGETWGWELGQDRSGSRAVMHNAQRAAVDMQTSYIQLRGALQHTDSGAAGPVNSLRLTAGGGLALVDGSVHLSRPIGDAYAIARVGNLAGVPITLNGITVGETNSNGELLLPRLSAHYENRLAIDSTNIPIEYALDRISRRIILPERTGAIVEFKVTRILALEGQLVLASSGEPIRNALLRLKVGQGTVDGATGDQGNVYLEQISPGRHIGLAEASAGKCQFVIEVPHNADMLVEVGTIVCTPLPPDIR